MKIISICNQKGGVGKTTTTMNIAAALVRQGLKVLCIDLDHIANLSQYLGHEYNEERPTITDLLQAVVNGKVIEPEKAICTSSEAVYYIPADVRLSSIDMFLAPAMFREQTLKRLLSVPAFQYYDYVLVDCLPSLGILLTNALIASDKLIIPIQAEIFAWSALEDLLGVIDLVKKQANPALEIEGLLITMRNNTVVSRTVEEDLRNRFGNLVFDTSISELVEAVESTLKKRSLINNPGSRIGAQYIAVANELLVREGAL